ncbi:MAG: hypothetical protein L7U47_06725 [Alphaproteobacteria bacterium]|nr:hypothetical protein [Alphaproteobacteria bacterium]
MQSSFITRLDALNPRLTQRLTMISSLIAVVLCLLGFQWLKARLGGAMLDELEGYDSETLRTQMLLYGEAGRSLHLRFTVLLDSIFPFAYGAFFGGLLVLAARGIFDKAVLLPVLAVMALDFAENIQLAMLLAGFPDLAEAQIATASATTVAKIWAVRFFLFWLLGLALWKLAVAVRARLG